MILRIVDDLAHVQWCFISLNPTYEPIVTMYIVPDESYNTLNTNMTIPYIPPDPPNLETLTFSGNEAKRYPFPC